MPHFAEKRDTDENLSQYSTINTVLERLESVRSSGQNRFIARCPAHEDRTSSLSVRATDDGRVLVHCFAGCDTRDVLHALNLEMKDLFPSSAASFQASSKSRVSTPKPVARGHEHAWLWRDLPDETLVKLEKASTLPDFPTEVLSALDHRKTSRVRSELPESRDTWILGEVSPLEKLASWIASCIRELRLEQSTPKTSDSWQSNDLWQFSTAINQSTYWTPNSDLWQSSNNKGRR